MLQLRSRAQVPFHRRIIAVGNVLEGRTVAGNTWQRLADSSRTAAAVAEGMGALAAAWLLCLERRVIAAAVGWNIPQG
jgi:hypothetical protein